MRKKLASVILCLTLCAFIFIGCTPPQTYAEIKANGLKQEIIAATDWFKDYYGLEKTDDLSKMPVLNVSGTYKSLITNSIRTVLVAKLAGITADYEAYYGKLETAFEDVYGNGGESGEGKSDVQGAYTTPLMNIVVRFLLALGKDATDFCGYDLLDLHVYGNEGFETAPEANDIAYALTTLKSITPPQSAKYSADDLIGFLAGQQTDDGFWGYDDWLTGEYMNDCDYTATAVKALSLYGTDEAKAALQKAKTALATFKNENGTYKGAFSNESSSSTAVVLCAYASLKDGVFKNAVTNETDPLSALRLFKKTDGGFAAAVVSEPEIPSEVDENPSDEYSTVDAIDALLAAYLYYSAA